MKFILFLFLSLCFFLTSKSQVSISCYYQSYCQLNEYTKQYENCNGESASSLFSFNEKETMFTHTTETTTSTYYVEKREYFKDKDLFTYDVVSDVGNQYYFVVDMKNKEIRVLYDSGGKKYVIIFFIKSMF